MVALQEKEQQCLDGEALSTKYQAGHTIAVIFLAITLPFRTVTQMSSNSWKPSTVAQIRQKAALYFISWDATLETFTEVSEQVGRLLPLCFSANSLERGNHAGLF